MDLEAPSNDPRPKVFLDRDIEDAQDLVAMGHVQSLTRKFSRTSMLSLALCVLGTLSVCMFVREEKIFPVVWTSADYQPKEPIICMLRTSPSA